MSRVQIVMPVEQAPNGAKMSQFVSLEQKYELIKFGAAATLSDDGKACFALPELYGERFTVVKDLSAHPDATEPSIRRVMKSDCFRIIPNSTMVIVDMSSEEAAAWTKAKAFADSQPKDDIV